MNLPSTREDLQRLIQNEVQESLHLDYKGSQGLTTEKNDVAKDVSAFANSDGGLIIWGITESGHKPTAVDSGVDHIRYNREWLENVITSNIAPKVNGIVIVQIPLSDSASAFAVKIPKSYRGPHQDRTSNRYYKRFNFKAEPMEDYEIADVRARSLVVPTLISFDIEIRHAVLVYFTIANVGKAVARDVQLKFSPEPSWPDQNAIPPIIGRGIKFFPPGKEFRIKYRTLQELFSQPGKNVTAFEVDIEYVHSDTGEPVSEPFHVDIEDYLYTGIPYSEFADYGKKLIDAIEKLTREVRKLDDHVESLTRLSGASGLDLSITTIRELAGIAHTPAPVRRLSPEGCDPSLFQEILNIDFDFAHKLCQHFHRSSAEDGLNQIEGMTPSILDRIRLHFILDNSQR